VTDADKSEFHWELMKLLLQVAWADDEIQGQERRLILGLAERLGLPLERRAELDCRLEGLGSLPPPNMGVLKARKAEVLQVAESLVLSDERLDDDENSMLAQLHELLGDG
jgi:uncharacterized tellurite resistance protein B-like protein